MANMSNYLEDQLRAHLFRSGTFLKPAALWIALHLADPTDAGTGLEVSVGGYARVQRNPGDANWTAPSPTDGVCKNAADIVFPSPTANWGTVTHWAIWDAATAGNLIGYGLMEIAKPVNNGDAAPLIPAGGLTLSFA
jgi:hypothetical protein